MSLTHHNWKFDYLSNGKYMYNVTSDTVADCYFKKYDEYDIDTNLIDYKKAALIHKIVRTNVKDILKDGVKYSDIITEAKSTLNRIIKPDKTCGFAFPIGISVNEIIAHDSAFVGDDRVLSKNDMVKIDIGIHNNGSIIDSAWTQLIEPDESMVDMYNPLIMATADATYSAISLSGVDMSLYDISTSIQEIIESYELSDGTPIKAVVGLGGHDILPYKVHGSKLIFSVPNEQVQEGQRMTDNEIFAIETYASSGYGSFSKKSDCTHFIFNENTKHRQSKLLKNNVVGWVINNNKLPFTQYDICHIDKWEKHLKNSIDDQMVIVLPALTDKIGSYTSQLEHTICVKEKGIEILSLGHDY
jgi:methionyl aminopeptidase